VAWNAVVGYDIGLSKMVLLWMRQMISLRSFTSGARSSKTAYTLNIVLGNLVLFTFFTSWDFFDASRTGPLSLVALHFLCSAVAVFAIWIAHAILKRKSSLLIRIVLSLLIPPIIQFIAVGLWFLPDVVAVCLIQTGTCSNFRWIEAPVMGLLWFPLFVLLLPLNFFVLRADW
jgi:hypothetical protein